MMTALSILVDQRMLKLLGCVLILMAGINFQTMLPSSVEGSSPLSQNSSSEEKNDDDDMLDFADPTAGAWTARKRTPLEPLAVFPIRITHLPVCLSKDRPSLANPIASERERHNGIGAPLVC